MTYTPHNHTMTSIDAARAATCFAIPQREKVLAAIRQAGIHGRTREELATELKISGDSIRPRCDSLLKDGVIVESGEIRRSASGRGCKVLVYRGPAHV